ncbi:hypothetical protein LTR56_019587 [Elasticomyces elasticus]|nr:hypothetical protein LTR56_019587 [Elasticomyces elasticus]KAK3634479.1 hypothetical protein LTR22_019638 [Elasticomyces elasticus]KAK4917085.1 hypothetical protein LTR49_014988 [Elasticomyces elasticus]KAK5750755.1 hypothetical protein LTS12_019200 [Elasticomyces elasticus]
MVSFTTLTTLGMAVSAMAFPQAYKPKADNTWVSTTKPCTTTDVATSTVTNDGYGSFSGASFGTKFHTVPTSVSTTTTVTSYLTVSIVSPVTTHSVPTVTDSSATTTLSTDIGAAATAYTGDGSTGAGWPAMNDWISTFDDLFEINKPMMKGSCTKYDQPNNSDDEINDLKSAVWSVSQSSSIDPRYILAVVMQESFGCVRVWGTVGAHLNPGLMQSHGGTGTCNTAVGYGGKLGEAGTASNPCSSDQITQMIKDGATGTALGDGLTQLLQKAGGNDDSKYYKAARMYNSGAESIPSDGDLSSTALAATASYSSDIANRLRGVVIEQK